MNNISGTMITASIIISSTMISLLKIGSDLVMHLLLSHSCPALQSLFAKHSGGRGWHTLFMHTCSEGHCSFKLQTGGSISGAQLPNEQAYPSPHAMHWPPEQKHAFLTPGQLLTEQLGCSWTHWLLTHVNPASQGTLLLHSSWGGVKIGRAHV